jgi:hypothetical protein
MSLLRQSIVAALLAAIIASAPAQSPTPPPSPTPDSQPLPADTSPLADIKVCTTTPDPDKPQLRFPSYLDDSFSQLKSAVPALRTLKFEDHPATGADDAEPTLNQAAQVLVAMVPRVPNLIAKEELTQASVTLPYTTGAGAQIVNTSSRRNSIPSLSNSATANPVLGEDLNKVLESMIDQPQQRTTFSYRIRSTDDPTFGAVLEEYRTNAKDQALNKNDFSAGNPRSVGFGSTWLMFVPANLPQARYRYLGRQKIDRHNTLVVAFAQDPQHAIMRAAVGIGPDACAYLSQGILWIDESQFQIIRLQTDLLAPLTGIHLNQLRSELHISEVKIPTRNLTLWMPAEVKISWQSKDSAGMELHRYSNYRLFGATSRIILPDPE